VDLRQEKVVVETDRYRVEGSLTLPSSGHQSRLSDHVNRRDLQFLTLQDATLTPLDGGRSWHTPLLMLSQGHVRLITPAAEPGRGS
jgi:hypothetical protein